MALWIKRIVVLLVVAGVAYGGFTFFGKKGANAAKDQPTYEEGVVEVRDVISSVTATGVIEPWKLVDIKSNVGGRIDLMTVDLGDKVKANQLLMRIDPTDPQSEKRQAEASLNSAKARLAQAQANLDQETLRSAARITAARRGVASAEARLAQARATMDAQPKITSSTIAEADAAVISARKAVAQARKNRQLLDDQLRELQEVTIPLNIATVDSTLDQARANLATAESDYNRLRQLHAQGFVAKSDVESAFARMATQRANVRTMEQRRRTLDRENALAIEQLKSRVEEAQAAIENQESRVRQAEAALEVAKTGEYQIEVRKQEHEAALASLDQAKQELEVALAEARQIRVRRLEIDNAQAQIVRDAAALERAKKNLEYTFIYAPRDGIVIAKNVEEGTVIASSRGSIGGTNALLQIGDVSKIWIDCKVDETDIGQIRINQRVTVRVDAYPSLLVEGKVIRIEPQAILEQNVTMIPVTVELSEPDDRFRPGMNAECEFIVDEALNVLTVPNEALREDQGAYKVQRLVGNKVIDVEVEVGLAGSDVTEIHSGLKEGEKVITKIIEPEKPEATNPFGSPFGAFGRPQRGQGGGAGGGGGAPRGGGR